MYKILLLALLAVSCRAARRSDQAGHNPPPHPPYEVKCVDATLDRMNVFYIGVDNPIYVSAAGVASYDVRVSIDNGTLDSLGHGRYVVRVSTPGQVSLRVNTPTSLSRTFLYRAKRIPDPVPILGRGANNEFEAFKFRQIGGLLMMLEDFDFEARCETVRYTVTRLDKNGQRQTATNEGARYGEAAKALVGEAQSGDLYIFSDIETKCPGDTENRRLRNLACFIR